MKKHTHHRKAPLRLLAGSGLLFSLFVPGYSQGAPGRAAAKPSTVLVQKAAAIDSAARWKPLTGWLCSPASPATS